MDAARDKFTELIAETDNRIVASIANQQTALAILWWVSIVGAIVILAGGVAAALLVGSYTRELLTARREIEVLNTSLEAKVEERTAELGRANSEIQRFAYIVTHDLRAPLVNIMGFTSEVETSLKPIQQFVAAAQEKGGHDLPAELVVAAEEDLPEAVGFIRSSTSKMDGLINAILKLSREGRRVLRPETLALDTVLEASAATIQHQLLDAKGEVQVKPSRLSVVSDRLVLEQVFGNLLDNAVKYRSAERPLSVQVVARKEPGGFIAIRVEDNGRGIAEQDLERVFELFRRSGPQNQPGEGIGLAHVRTMVRNLGGDITVQSKLGIGSTFTVLLPLNFNRIAGAS
jgi:signal transduction histidine kinase